MSQEKKKEQDESQAEEEPKEDEDEEARRTPRRSMDWSLLDRPVPSPCAIFNSFGATWSTHIFFSWFFSGLVYDYRWLNNNIKIF